MKLSNRSTTSLVKAQSQLLSEMPRPQSSLDREAFDDFNTRNPMAGGGRIGLYKGMSAKKAPQKFKLEKDKN